MKRHFSASASQFVEELLGQGRYTFTRKEAVKYLGTSSAAAYLSLRRLAQAKRLVMPKAGFYVIVDPQHRVAGTLPPEWFIHDLMKNIARPYYVGLLSAAQFHGAAHHHPQRFQVVIPERTIRPIKTGNLLIWFYGKGEFERSQTQEIKTPTGILRISAPETTAWDIIRYPKAAGGLENAVTVLSELVEKLDRNRLRDVLKRHGELIVAQRMGYLLDKIHRQDLSKGFAGFIKKAPLRPLDPTESISGASTSRKWNLLINARIEPEA